MSERLCQNCRYWWPDAEGVVSGDCRINPPSLSGVAVPGGNSIHQDPRAAMWPSVNSQDWCGAFSQAPDDCEHGLQPGDCELCIPF